MSHGGQHWHANDNCFKCYTCCKALLGSPFLPKNGVTYCSAECSRGIPNHFSNDSANDSLPSNNNSKEDLLPLAKIEYLKNNNNNVQPDTNTFSSQTANSEGYGSLQSSSATAMTQSLNVKMTIESDVEDDEEETTELLTRSQMIEAKRKNRRVSYNLPPRLPKSNTWDQLTELNRDTGRRKSVDCINRPVSKMVMKRRSSLPSKLNIQAHMPPAHDDCSTCSSSDDSDEEYEAEVLRSKGLSNSSLEQTTPTSDRPTFTHHEHRRHSKRNKEFRRTKSQSGSCKVQ